VLAELAAREPGRPLAAVGFSLGGNVLLKLLGDAGPDGAGIEAAVAISVPYDLAAGADVLERSALGRRYARYFLSSLVAKVRAKRSLLEDLVDVEAALASPNIRAFDERVTAPLHGFQDADHYYAASSSGPVLSDIRVPTLLIHAMDDPFLPPDRVPTRAAEANPWLHPAFLDRGGHVGFVEGPVWRPRFWAERTASGFLAAALGPGTPTTPRP
jgi:predicted alpha/beta-fold hydrolase